MYVIYSKSWLTYWLISLVRPTRRRVPRDRLPPQSVRARATRVRAACTSSQPHVTPGPVRLCFLDARQRSCFFWRAHLNRSHQLITAPGCSPRRRLTGPGALELVQRRWRWSRGGDAVPSVQLLSANDLPPIGYADGLSSEWALLSLLRLVVWPMSWRSPRSVKPALPPPP